MNIWQSLNRLATGAGILLMASCGVNRGPEQADDSSPISPEGYGLAKINITTSGSPYFQLIADRAEVSVTSPEMASIHQALRITDTSVTGTVNNIPAGKNRIFTVFVYDAESSLVYTGADTADVVAQQLVPVRIPLYRIVGGVIINGEVIEPSPLPPAPATAFFEDDQYTVALWRFNEGQGDTAFDCSGNGNHGKLVNNPAWVTGRFGGALAFDTVNYTYVDVAHKPCQVGMSQYSIEAVVCLERDVPDYANFLDKNGPGSDADDAYSAGYGLNNKAYNMLTNSFNHFRCYSLAPVPRNEWHVIQFCYDGTTAKMYVNGVLDTTYQTPAWIVPDNGRSIYIGGYPAIVSRAHLFKGKIDEIRISSCARPARPLPAVLAN